MKPPVRGLSPCAVLTALLLAGLTGGVCAAAEHIDGFEGDRPSWKILHDASEAAIRAHSRTSRLVHGGKAAEEVVVEAAAATSELVLEYELPPARLLEELRLSVWLHSNRDGATLALRVVLPRQVDPRTGEILTIVLDGDAYTKVGKWQALECRDLRTKFDRALPVIRKTIQELTGTGLALDLEGLYVDRALLRIRTGRGAARYLIDDLRLGPIVESPDAAAIRQAEHSEAPTGPPVRLQQSRLEVEGKPFFPRIVPYHGESLSDLAKMRLNTAWVPDYRDLDLLADLRRAGLWAMAVPPRATVDGERIDATSVALAPFRRDTSPILFWYLGTRIPPDARNELFQWEDQIRNADQAMNRPVMADVGGLERSFSKRLSMLGVSRPVLGTSFGLKNYRDWLIERRNLAQHGSFVWTWIQTEPVPSIDEQSRAAGWTSQVIEPEQLRLQVYAALAAGCRGIGFWTHASLDEDRPGALERKLTIAQLCMELELLEPFLATGGVIGQNPFSILASGSRSPTRTEPAPAGGRSGAAAGPGIGTADRTKQRRQKDKMSRELDAAILQSGSNILVLPIWYGDDAQFCPGQMAANEARIVVPGVGESARAWQISTTEIKGLSSERVAGGSAVTLQKLDMTAVILFTEDETLHERLRDQMRQMAGASARVSLELARAKLERVSGVDQILRQMGKGQTDAARFLKSARHLIDQAEAAWRAERHHDSRTASNDALQLLRMLQRVYWDDAVGRMRSPVASPHTLCFQTLPDHWDMIVRLGRTRDSEVKNVLRSGDFEDFDTVVAEGWKHELATIDGIRATAELDPRARSGTYCLRLVAAPAAGRDAPVSVAQRPVSVTTPAVTVHKGQLVYISGWVKVSAPSLGNLDGAMLYDSLAGLPGALRWRTPTPDWQPFELVREVPETGELTLTMALTGLGEIRFDDLQIKPLDPDNSVAGKNKNGPPAKTPGKSGPLDFLKRWPNFGGSKSEAE